jgi:hypothetical protein
VYCARANSVDGLKWRCTIPFFLVIIVVDAAGQRSASAAPSPRRQTVEWKKHTILLCWSSRGGRSRKDPITAPRPIKRGTCDLGHSSGRYVVSIQQMDPQRNRLLQVQVRTPAIADPQAGPQDSR